MLWLTVGVFCVSCSSRQGKKVPVQDPIVSVVIKNALATNERGGILRAEVSNIEAIDLEIGVTSHEKGIPEDFSEGKHFSVDAYKSSDGSSSKAPIEIKDIRYTIRRGAPKAFISFIVPVDPKVRRAKIEKYMDDLLKAGTDSNRMGSHFAEGVKMNRQIFIREFEETFVENSLGSYELHVIYENKRPNYWQGRVTSLPILIDVVDKGSYFDTLNTGSSVGH